MIIKKIWEGIVATLLEDKCEDCGKRSHKQDLVGYNPNVRWVCMDCSKTLKLKEEENSRRRRKLPEDGWSKWAREHGCYGYGR